MGTIDALNNAFNNGYNSIDTASLYKCEHLIGQYLKENEINVCLKLCEDLRFQIEAIGFDILKIVPYIEFKQIMIHKLLEEHYNLL